MKSRGLASVQLPMQSRDGSVTEECEDVAAGALARQQPLKPAANGELHAWDQQHGAAPETSSNEAITLTNIVYPGNIASILDSPENPIANMCLVLEMSRRAQ